MGVRPVASANWDSLVFDLGTDPLRRVPMMDPLRGTAEHVEELLRECATPAEVVGTVERLGGRRMPERELKRKPAAAPREEQVIEEARPLATRERKLKAELAT